MEPVQKSDYHFPIRLVDDKMKIHTSEDFFACATCPGENENVTIDSYETCMNSAAKKILDNIKCDLTPEDFDKFRQQFPYYKFEDSTCAGINALSKAVTENNPTLVKHIKKINPNLINLGSKSKINGANGWTSLFWAAAANKYDIAKILISCGGDVNSATSTNFITEANVFMAFSTPLMAASEKLKPNFPLIQLLVCNGGIIHLPLSEKGQKNVDDAMQDLFEKTKVWMCPNDFPFNMLNKDVRLLILQNYF